MSQSATTAIKVHGDDYFTQDQLNLLTDHIMKGASPTEVQYFGEVCKRVGLDPFKKQIHAVQRWDNQSKRMVWSYQTGIDGYRSIANSTGAYAGSDEPKFLPADESTPNPTKATVTVWKLVAGQRVPFSASARWEEYVQLTKENKPNSMWRKMPYGQLAKCAEALALRKAFPERLSGIHTDEEMDQADNVDDRPGEQPAGRPAHFSMESKTFDPESKSEAPKQDAKQEPAPSDQTEATVVLEAEIVPNEPKPAKSEPQASPDNNNTGMHPKVAKLLGGGWKKDFGADKGKPLAEARKAAFENAEKDPTRLGLALASIVDEIRARLAANGFSEKFLAEHLAENGVIESPQHLWTKAALYPDILDVTKTLKKAQ